MARGAGGISFSNFGTGVGTCTQAQLLSGEISLAKLCRKIWSSGEEARGAQLDYNSGRGFMVLGVPNRAPKQLGQYATNIIVSVRRSSVNI
jgi:hypothetical protein